MTAGVTLADAIAALVCEKRAVGYKYVSEERALARFRAFCVASSPAWTRSREPPSRRGSPRRGHGR